MMKKLILMAAGLLVFLTACNKNNPDEIGTDSTVVNKADLVGEWSLTHIATKTATLGGQTVNVYLSFGENGKFELYQQIGQGWYSYFSGSWTLKDNVLSGSYDGGTQWGSTYTVSFSGSSMTLTTASGGETDTYTKTSIPDEVKNKVWTH